MSREMQNSPGSLRDALYKLWRKFRNAFSASEMLTGQVWTDGAQIKRIVLDTGALPDTDTSDVAHGIAALGTVLRIYGMASDGTTQIPLPKAGGAVQAVDEGGAATYTVLASAVEVSIDATEVHLTTYEDLSSFDSSFLVIEYLDA